MAFKVSDYHGYGSGANGDVTNPSVQINSYANVSDYDATSITLNATKGFQNTAGYQKFTNNVDIMIHVSAVVPPSTETRYLGKYVIARITNVATNKLYIDRDFTQILPKGEFAKYRVQAVTAADFKTLTLNTDYNLVPVGYNATYFYGGILFVRCNNSFVMNGGHVNLLDRGIPVANKDFRPMTPQENKGTKDADKYSGWENSETKDRFLLNSGDGAFFLVTRNVVFSNEKSRIGNTSAKGVQYCRGASDSTGHIDKTSNIGGSTILIAADKISDFKPDYISKYRVGTEGSGLCRCYIASKNKLRNDEGLYAYDCISEPHRVVRNMRISSFGDGNHGSKANPDMPLNNYAQVTTISKDGRSIVYKNKTTDGLARIEKGAIIMFQVIAAKSDVEVGNIGRFILAKVIEDDGAAMIVDKSINGVFGSDQVSNFSCQIVSIPRFTTLSITNKYSHTTKYDTVKGIGGVFAVMCDTLLDLEGGQIDLVDKGGAPSYGEHGLSYIGNAQNYDALPIGASNASALLIAKEIKFSKNSRIGNTTSGAEFGGNGKTSNGGGYRIANANFDFKTVGQGSHIMIVSDIINGFSVSPLSSGGYGAGYGAGGKVVTETLNCNCYSNCDCYRNCNCSR